jgi:hypothetical protein
MLVPAADGDLKLRLRNPQGSNYLAATVAHVRQEVSPPRKWYGGRRTALSSLGSAAAAQR